MIGQPFNSNNCLFVANQALNAGQFGAVPNTSNQTNHTVLWDFVANKLYWVNTLTNLIEREIDGAGGIQNEAYEIISQDNNAYLTSFGDGQNVFGANYLLLPAGTYTFELEWDMLPLNSLSEGISATNLQAEIRTNTNQALTNVDISDVIQSQCVSSVQYTTSSSPYPLVQGDYDTANQTLSTGAVTFNQAFIVKSSFEALDNTLLNPTCYFNKIQLRALLVK
jgi:hypothetical protein